ncbi:MAG: hypothetical protein ABSF91_07560 [Bacteroidota bacterium]
MPQLGSGPLGRTNGHPNMKRFYFSILLIAIVGFCLCLPFHLIENTRKLLLDGMSILSAVASLLTLVIALLLFEKFGIEATLLKKQTEAVMRLLDAIRKFEMLIHGDRHYILFRVSRRNVIYYKEFYNKILIFNTSAFRFAKELDDSCEDVFMPKEILKKIAPLRISMISSLSSEEQNSKEYLKVDYSFDDRKESKEDYGLPEEEKISFQQYVTYWNEIVLSIQQWLQKNSSIKVDLNI